MEVHYQRPSYIHGKLSVDMLWNCDPNLYNVPNPIKFKELENQKIQEELDRFETLDVIERVYNASEDAEFISNIVRPKTDGTIRIILNLSKFNENVPFLHFKMETLHSAQCNQFMTRNYWMGSSELTSEHLKWFRSLLNNQKHPFKVLVMGLV